MNCTIGGPNVKALAKAIQALARIGDDLYLESLPTGLVFRTVNSSRSAYVCITFKLEFFAQYEGNIGAKCKVSLKSCVMAFRSLPTMEKTVEKCMVDTASVDSMLLIEFSCKHELTKTYHLPFIENETVQATFAKQRCQCELIAPTRLLHDGIQNFNSGVEEVTLMIATGQVMLKNYVDDDVEQNKVVHTELTIEAEEFDTYVLQEEVDVTFSLKEFKAILSFAEGFNVPITISCQCSGKPIVFSINEIAGIEAEFVLATLTERGNPSSATHSQGSFVSGSQADERVTVTASKKNERGSKLKNKSKGHNLSSVHVVSHVPGPDIEACGDQASQDDSVILLPSTQNSDVEVRDLNVGEQNLEDDEMDLVIPCTPPPKKKFRMEFLGLLSEAPEYTSMLPDPDEVLAEATDEDD